MSRNARAWSFERSLTPDSLRRLTSIATEGAAHQATAKIAMTGNERGEIHTAIKAAAIEMPTPPIMYAANPGRPSCGLDWLCAAVNHSSRLRREKYTR